jgi:hypothetical protein
VLGRDPDHLAKGRVLRAGRTDDHGITADDLDRVVVEVIVRHQKQVGRDLLDPRAVRPETSPNGSMKTH